MKNATYKQKKLAQSFPIAIILCNSIGLCFVESDLMTQGHKQYFIASLIDGRIGLLTQKLYTESIG